MNDRQKPFVIPIFIPYAGCPHRCVFCNQQTITGISRPPAARQIRMIVDQFLSYNRHQRKPVQVAFFGGNFLGLAPEVVTTLLNEAESFVRKGLIDNIRFSTRPDTICPETLDLISTFSVRTIELGVQSMDDTVLSLCRRGHTAGQSIAALRMLRERHYETGAQMMTGLPGDSGVQSVKTAEVLTTLRPDLVRIYPAVVISGSVLADWYQQGTYLPATIEEAVSLVSALYRIFDSHQIPVIRMGLQPNEELNQSDKVLAGPFHPAFGHLVLSRIFLKKAIRAISGHGGHPKALTLVVCSGQASALRGLRNSNIKHLQETFSIESISVVEDNALSQGQVICR